MDTVSIQIPQMAALGSQATIPGYLAFSHLKSVPGISPGKNAGMGIAFSKPSSVDPVKIKYRAISIDKKMHFLITKG